MATTINADTSNGLVVTPDTSGVLELQSNGVTVLKVDSPTGSLTIPVGTTAERPVSPTVGMMRYNTTEAYYEQYDGSAWVEAGGSAYDAPTTSTGYFALPSGTTAQRPGSPTVGMIRYNTTESEYESYGGTEWGRILTANYPYEITLLSIAGGGGGADQHAGGGGGGGKLTSTTSLSPGTIYTAAVGAGGSNGSQGINGNNSTFTGVSPAIGGGGGARGGAGNSGGSGGGGPTGGAGTAGQGFAGASGGSGNTGYAGGGGAGAVGVTNSGNNGGAGGAGSASSITGSAITYGGGGGGGSGNAGGGLGGTGGTGGGGRGSNNMTGGVAGTANLGGGGGGGGGQTNIGYSNGAPGGSGVIILSVPTAKYSGTTTGSPTITTSGANTIIKFTSSGTYTA